MKCRMVKNLFSPWLDGELNPVEAGEFQRHIAGCASCRAELSEWQEISGIMRCMAEAVAAPEGFAGSVRARLSDVRPQRFPALSAGWRKGLVAAAAALVVVASASLGLAGRLLPLQHVPSPAIVGQNHPGVLTGSDSVPDASVTEEGTVSPAGGEEPGGTVSDGGAGSGTLETTETAPGTGETAARSSAGQQATGERKPPQQVKVAIAPGSPVEPKAFLDKERIITSTLLKVAVSDLPAATEEALALADRTGTEYQALAVQNSGDRQIKIIRFTAPKDSGLLAQLTGLGTVIDKQSEVQDVTASFTATLEKYRELLAQQGSTGDSRQQAELRARAALLEQQLSAWDQEAEKQVITLWLETK